MSRLTDIKADDEAPVSVPVVLEKFRELSVAISGTATFHLVTALLGNSDNVAAMTQDLIRNSWKG